MSTIALADQGFGVPVAGEVGQRLARALAALMS
jgi:hypothetical protein